MTEFPHTASNIPFRARARPRRVTKYSSKRNSLPLLRIICVDLLKHARGLGLLAVLFEAYTEAELSLGRGAARFLRGLSDLLIDLEAPSRSPMLS